MPQPKRQDGDAAIRIVRRPFATIPPHPLARPALSDLRSRVDVGQAPRSGGNLTSGCVELTGEANEPSLENGSARRQTTPADNGVIVAELKTRQSGGPAA